MSRDSAVIAARELAAWATLALGALSRPPAEVADRDRLARAVIRAWRAAQSARSADVDELAWASLDRALVDATIRGLGGALGHAYRDAAARERAAAWLAVRALAELATYGLDATRIGDEAIRAALRATQNRGGRRRAQVTLRQALADLYAALGLATAEGTHERTASRRRRRNRTAKVSIDSSPRGRQR